MRYETVVIVAILVAAAVSSPTWAEPIPDWVKTSAGWWAEGITTDAEFVAAIQHLIGMGIIIVEHTEHIGPGESDTIPDWVKTSAGWWAEGITTDAEFVAAIQHLIGMGIIIVDTQEYKQEDPRMAQLYAELETCAEYTKAYQKLDCEKGVKHQITRLEYETNATPYMVGPVIYYYPGANLDMTGGGQPLLTVRMLAANDGEDNVTLSCSGPAVCNYDVTDGSNVYKYASTDFTSGSITIKPGDAREFEIIFGPNIGYGGTTFVYDPAKEYQLRINEGFGSILIPLNIE